ncbi:MAG: amidohydrolase, partial [Hyphomonadaceae bacterium]
MKSVFLKFGVTLAVSLGIAATAFAQTQNGAPIPATYIYAGNLIAKAGSPPMPRKTIVVQNGLITEIKDGFVPNTASNVTIIDLRDKTVMPGMIDSHVHLSHERGANSRLYTV